MTRISPFNELGDHADELVQNLELPNVHAQKKRRDGVGAYERRRVWRCSGAEYVRHDELEIWVHFGLRSPRF